MQHLGRVGHGEQGTSFGVALAQGGVAELIGLAWRRLGLELGDATLDALVVSKDLGDPQGAGFVDCFLRCSAEVVRQQGIADLRPSAMSLALVRVMVWVGIERKVNALAGCQGVPSFLQVARRPFYGCMSALHEIVIRGRLGGKKTDG